VCFIHLSISRQPAISFVILSVAVFVDVFKKQSAVLLDISDAITFKVIFLIFSLHVIRAAMMIVNLQ
ncbi:hypothetical protein, partial [Kingella kingae]|uniref:hypothetical protein n=1 Tax=Kingella kingae TaxID=504 RepID=UPI001EE2EFA1